MADGIPNSAGTKQYRSSATPDEYAIVLPCDPAHFKDFVTGLLGKPQTIRKTFAGPFDVGRQDIENFYHLVNQRVTQQNEATLIQFSVRVVYDDQSSVLLNSIEDFVHYNEVRPIGSIAAHLSWSFLVRFQDREVPEKQQIDISINAVGYGPIFDADSDLLFVHRPGQSGLLGLRIHHTARTWGADIEALLTGHIQTLVKQTHPVRAFLIRHNEAAGLFVAAAFFLGAVASSLYTTQRFLSTQTGFVKTVSQLSAADPVATAQKVDHALNLMASGTWPRFFYYLSCFLFVCLLVSIGLGVWAGSAAGNEPPSFLTLSKRAEERKLELLRKDKRHWYSFIGSLVVSLITGVAGNWLFAYYFQGWRPK